MSDFALAEALEPHSEKLAQYDGDSQEPDTIQEESKAPLVTTGSPLAFPRHVMSGAAGAFSHIYSQYIESPASFLYMAYLTVLGNILSDKITLQSENKPEPRLFNVILGRSADERKSTAISKTVKFFKDAVTEGINICYGVGSAEGLAKALQDNPKLILTVDELKTFVQKARIEASVLLPCVNSLFEENHFQSATKKHIIKLENTHLSLLAASTLDTFQTMFSSAFLDIGFINRLFLVLDQGKKKFAIPKMIPQQVKDDLAKGLRDVLIVAHSLSQQKRPYPMPIHPGAERLFAQWYFEAPRSVFSKRLDTYGHRLMPLLAINDKKKHVDVETVEKVIALLNYELAVRRECDPVDADNKIAILEERIRRALENRPLSKRQLERKLNKARAGSFNWRMAIKNLTEDAEISWNQEEGVYERL